MAHIAMLLLTLDRGGAERSVLTIVDGLARRGHSVDIVFPMPIRDGHPMKFPDSVSVHFLSGLHMDERQRSELGIPETAKVQQHNPDRFERFVQTSRIYMRKLKHPEFRSKEIQCAFRLLTYVEKISPDIIFANSMNGKAEFAMHYLAKTTNNFPPIVSIFRSVALDEKLTRRRKAKMSKSFYAVAVSDGALQSFEAAGIVEPRQGRTIYNPACTPDIGELAQFEPDHPWFSDDGPPVILGVGRLVPQKDFPTLIDAFRHVHAKRPCRLVILGDGPLRPELEAHIVGLGLDDCVSLPGWVDNPFAFMARAALFALSSVYEGFGLVLVEALACGCPAVSTDCRAGPSEILEDPALLAPVGDPEALAQVMLRALDRPLDKAALRASAARFSVERAMDGYEALIAEVLAERGQSRIPENGQ